MVARLSLVLLMTLGSMAAVGCSAPVDEASEGASEDDVTSATFTRDDDGRASYFDKARAISVVFEGTSRTEWIVDDDGGLGEARTAFNDGKYTFKWSKSAVGLGEHSLHFVYRDKNTGTKKDEATIVFVVGDRVAATETRIGLDARDRTISVPQGNRVILELPQNASTGYMWDLVTSGTLEAPTKEYSAVSQGGPVGGGGYVYFTWKTEGVTGSHTVKLEKTRGSDVAETLSFKIKVTAGASE